MALKDDANELKGILGEVQKAMEGINASNSKYNSGLSDSKSAMEEILAASKEYQEQEFSRFNIFKKTKDLSADELKTLSDKISKNKEILVDANKQLKIAQQISIQKAHEQRGLIAELQAEKASNKNNFDKQKLLDKHLENLEGIEKELSTQGKQLKQNNKLLEDADGSLADVENKIKGAAKASAAFGKLGKALDGIDIPFMNMLNPLQLINSIIQFIIGGFVEVDKTIGETAKSMNMTYAEAEKTVRASKKLSETTIQVGDKTKELGVTYKEIVKSNNELQASLGTSVGVQNLSKDLQKGVALMAELETYAGLSAEETQGIMKYSAGTGKEAENVTKQIMAGYKVHGLQNKLMLNEKDAMKAIAKTSKAIQLSTKGGAQGLGEALAAAKGLGVSLDKVDGIAGSILNFEDSIASELEAELLTGKELNLEKARQAALDGDLATVAEEIANQVGSAAQFTEMNRIQQEAMAKAVGMTREELAASLMEQEALRDFSAESVEKAQEEFDLKVAEVGLADAMVEYQDNALAKQFEQKSIAEQINIEKEKEKQKVMDSVKSMAEMGKELRGAFKEAERLFNKFGGMETVIKSIAGIIGLKMVKGMFNFGKGLKDGIKYMSTLNAKSLSNAKKEVVGASYQMAKWLGPAGLLAVGGLIGAGMAYLTADDMFSPGGGGGGYGNRTLMGPEGAIALNNKDDIIAGTDLFKGNDVSSEGGGATKMGGKGTMSVGSNMSSVVEAINTLSAKVEAMANRPINVGIDGKKVVEAGTGNNPNTFGEEVGKNSFALQ